MSEEEGSDEASDRESEGKVRSIRPFLGARALIVGLLLYDGRQSPATLPPPSPPSSSEGNDTADERGTVPTFTTHMWCCCPVIVVDDDEEASDGSIGPPMEGLEAETDDGDEIEVVEVRSPAGPGPPRQLFKEEEQDDGDQGSIDERSQQGGGVKAAGA